MKLTFVGATRTVTGSQYLLETGHTRLLVDCGMYQGSDHTREQGRLDYPLNPADLTCVLLTHAHIDHSGNLPLLARHGFRGTIFATEPTVDLCNIMLTDSAHIQEEDARFDLKKWGRKGRVGPPPTPLYTVADAAAALRLFLPVKYDRFVEVAPGIRARWRDAGHILGAASIELRVEKDGREVGIVFSGDIGQPHRPLLRDPHPPDPADFVIMESTYGNRLHESRSFDVDHLRELVLEAAGRRGHIIIPAFAVGRTQELLYELNGLIENRRIPRVPVYLDSPLAISATRITERHADCFDERTQAQIAAGDNPMNFPGLQMTRTVNESKEINTSDGPRIIISASGMCTAGRIRHHLRHHLPHPNDVVLFVGFQASGTLGRILQDGARSVKLFGEWVDVRARVQTMYGFSAHADANGLLQWL